MNEIEIGTIIVVLLAIISGIVYFFVTINKLNVEIEKLKSRDEIQQTVIDSFKQQAEQLIPVLIDQLNKKKKNGK